MEPGLNCIGGEWRPSLRGASFQAAADGEPWPQSDTEDVALARQAAQAGAEAWSRTGPAERARRVLALAGELERDEELGAALAGRCGLSARELAPHLAELAAAVRETLAQPVARGAGVTWCAPDWRELVRTPLSDLARELCAGRAVVLVSDARVPELAHGLARAALAADLPAGVVGLLHGATRELVGLALSGGDGACRLIASGSVERMGELRRACEARVLCDVRLRALRCQPFEVDPARELAASAAEVTTRAFGRATTLSGQLPGTLGRVFCPARVFSAFSERLLAEVEASHAGRAPVPQIDGEAAARVRAAWELGLDEGATCIHGGAGGEDERVLEPTIFTNVEGHMQSARRQEPLPVLCLLRTN